MNTFKLLFVLCTLFTTSLVTGQAKINPAIQTSLDAFIKYSNEKNWDKAFDLLYPKLFNRVPKQDLVDLMVGMEKDGMSLGMKNTRITSTSVPVTEGNETFVRVEYDADMDVNLASGGIYDHPKAVQAMDQQFKTTYGESNVKWSEDQKAYQIKAHKAMMAINTGNDTWKLVEINMDQPELMEYLFSPTIMDALVRVE
ncbi:MAG TPA: hypothetical protein VGK46_01090 [Saprospiraceae bacterium]|jgi:hypothetical protein